MANNYTYNDLNDILFLPLTNDLKSITGQEPSRTDTGCEIVATEKLPGTNGALFCPGEKSVQFSNLPINFSANQDFTVDFYMRYQGSSSGITSSNHSDRLVGFAINDDFVWYGIGNIYALVGSGDFLVNEWAHYALVRKAGASYWFINGELRSQIATSAVAFASKDFTINARYTYGASESPAHYAFVRISNIARWTEDFIPPEPKEFGEPKFMVTEEYQDELGNQLQAETIQSVARGQNYSKIPPSIPNYQYIGYKINNGALTADDIVNISNIQQDYHVTFIYRKIEQSGGSGGVPAGMIMYFGAANPPDGWLECNGEEVSRTTYENLFNVVGSTFGDGDGVNTFNLPDLQGEFIRGFDKTRGIDQARQFGSKQAPSLVINDNDATNNVADVGSLELANNPQNAGYDMPVMSDYPNLSKYTKNTSGTVTGDIHYAFTENALGATRPRNIALLPCIKY